MKEYKKELLGFTAGNFDLLHPGYIKCFKEAKKYCDKFIVFLQRDPSLHRKSKYKPVIPIFDRYEALKSIRYVDEVYTYQTEEELYELIKFWKPDVRILGEDYIGRTDFTGYDLPQKVVYTTRSHGWSTTKLKDLITEQTLKQNPEWAKEWFGRDETIGDKKSFTGDDLPPKIVYTTRSHGWSTTKLKDLITDQTLKQRGQKDAK